MAQLKIWNEASQRWEAVSGSLTVEKLDDLSDVVITGTPADNEAVAFDTATGKFINQAPIDATKQPLDAMLTALAALDSGQQGYIVNAAADTPVIIALKNNATAPPDADDDVDFGFLPVSIWVDVTNDKAYICVDSTDGAAVWKEITVAAASATVSGIAELATQSEVDAGSDALRIITPATFGGSSQLAAKASKTQARVSKTGELLGATIVASGTLTGTYAINRVHAAATMIKVIGETDTGTVTFNIEERALGSRDLDGTDTLTDDLVADSTGESSATFDNAGIAAEAALVLSISEVSGSPNIFSFTVVYDIDV